MDTIRKTSDQIAEITRILLEMRDNCLKGTLFDDPKRWIKFDALSDAVDLINQAGEKAQKWHSGSCPPRERGEVLVIARGKPKENIQLLDAYELAEYVPGEGWIFEAYPEWENGEVRWWMPLPEEPEEGNA